MKYAVDFSGWIYIDGDDITSEEDAEKRFWDIVNSWEENKLCADGFQVDGIENMT